MAKISELKNISKHSFVKNNNIFKEDIKTAGRERAQFADPPQHHYRDGFHKSDGRLNKCVPVEEDCIEK